MVSHAHSDLAADLADHAAVIDDQAKLCLCLPRFVDIAHGLGRADDRINIIPCCGIALRFGKVNRIGSIRLRLGRSQLFRQRLALERRIASV
jgi:hypothetical protein